MSIEPWVLLGTQEDEEGRVHRIGVPLADLKTHGFIIGTTGSGKSTLLRNLALQAFGLGASVAVIEPHGDLCLDLLAAVPDEGLHQVVYVDVTGVQPPSIPLLTLGLAGGLDAAVDAAMSVLRMAEPASWDQSLRMREVLRHTLRVVLDALGPEASLVAVDRFLSPNEDLFRDTVLARVSEENARSKVFAQDEIAAALEGVRGKGGLRESILAARRRVELFVTDYRLRRVMALPPLGPTLSLRHLLAEGKMALLPVNQAVIGSKVAGVVAMLFMQMAKTAFLGRVDRQARRQALLIIDEFAAMAGAETGGQEVADITGTLLAEARKFGASVILATQSAAQLTPEVAKKVQINTNLKVILLVSDPEEARQAARILGSDLVTDTDIRSLPRFHGYVRAMVHKQPMPPAMLKMLPPMRLERVPFRDGFPAPEPPEVSDLWHRVRAMARGLADPEDVAAAREVVAFLRSLSEEDWRQVVRDARAWNRYHAARLLAEPHRVPDRAERARRISRMLYGLPWWLREAHLREADRFKPKRGRPRREALQEVEDGWG